MYVGVRIWPNSNGSQAASRLSEFAPLWRSRLGRPWEREAESFPVWRWIEVEGDSLDESRLVDQARHAAWQCWSVTASNIDTVLNLKPAAD